MNPLVLALGGVVLFFAGLGLGYLMSRRPGDREAADELAAVRQDFETYREGVTRHFRDSAGHFQAIGEQYRALYAHMADGAKTFCAGGPEQEAIEFAPQPELAAPDAASGRGPLTAAAAATALSEASGEELLDDEADLPDRREPVLDPDEDADVSASAAAESEPGETTEPGETPDARTGETESEASDAAEHDEKELQEQPGDEQIRGSGHKETQAPGSGLLH